MSTTVLVTFVVTTIVLGVTPGPNMSLIIANTLAGGMRAGFVTLAGTGTGLAVLATVTVLGMSSVMAFMSEWFDWVRWIGALYLIFLGTRQLVGYLRRRGDPTYAPPEVSATSAYSQGLLVALSNPKVLLFLGAFFPQFVDRTTTCDPGDPVRSHASARRQRLYIRCRPCAAGHRRTQTRSFGRRCRGSSHRRRTGARHGTATGGLTSGGLTSGSR
jgi:homoserine/homoserine lactone efflux protein